MLVGIAFSLLHKPGCYFVIGNGGTELPASAQRRGRCVLPNLSYDFNDASIPIDDAMCVKRIEACFKSTEPSRRD
jgi:hippurate hydrolase